MNSTPQTKLNRHQLETYDECASPKCTADSADSPLNDSTKKWNCTTCTYSNWKNSLKCIFSQTPRHHSPSSTASSSIVTSSNEDSTSSTNGDDTSNDCKLATSCISLSKQNELHPKETDLTQVNNNLNAINSGSAGSLTDKASELEYNSLSSHNHQLTPKHIKPSTSTDKRESAYDDHHHLDHSSSLNSNLSTASTKHSSNSSLKNVDKITIANDNKLIDSLQTSLNKWRCSTCTYLNYVRAIKCTLCQTPKALNTTSASNSITHSSTSITTPISDLHSICSTESIVCSGAGGSKQTIIDDQCRQRNSPSPIVGATCQRNRLNSNLNNVNNIITYSSNLNNGSNRRKNREQFVDWMWLEACIGVLNADPEPVLLYLNNGGDLARQLTLVEVNFLNKQTLLGNTLVHLAIRFKLKYPKRIFIAKYFAHQHRVAFSMAEIKQSLDLSLKLQLSISFTHVALITAAWDIVDDRSEILEILLENRSPNRAKRVPCQVSINYGHETRKIVSTSLKQRKGDFPCYFVNDFCTFALPQDILELSPSVQECLFEDLLDKDVQNELEESSIINWSLEINVTLGSRLYALWNRSKGDCLLDSVLQATYGVFDKDNRLRKSLADSLSDAAHTLFVRFKEAEILKVSHQLPFALDQTQWEKVVVDDWAVILSLASQPGSALEQFHIFVLSHILRRPIIVYGVKFFKSYRGEKLALAGFQGVYLPLHWDPKFCTKSPISLAYTKGHFTALVPMEGMSSCVMSCICENGQVNSDCSSCVVSGAGNIVKSNFDTDSCYLPLVASERELLPLQFLVKSELGRQEEIMRQYLDCCVTDEGILVCKQKLQTKKPYPMQMMLNEWLDFYRDIPVCMNSKTSADAQSVNNSIVSKSTNEPTNPYEESDEDSD